MIHNIISFPLFWPIFTIFIFKISQKLKKSHYFSKIPPIIFSALCLIFILHEFSIRYADYNHYSSFLTYLLGPATVALAYPLVKNFDLIMYNKRAVFFGVLMSSVVSICSVCIISKILGASESVKLSLVPKSITTPIAVEVSKNIGGIPELTVCIVIITGLLGALMGHRLLKLFKIRHDLSIGLAIGSSSHVLGTSKCIEKKEEKQAAISGLAIILCALCTAIISPILLRII